MNDQPIIIEETKPLKIQQSHEKILNDKFFTLLDGVEQYDSLSVRIKQKYQQAMLGLASIKFTDPNALKSTAHRCVPAFLKISENNKLEYEYSDFTNKVNENDVYYDEFEDQEQISQECAKKQQKLQKIKDDKEKADFCENQLLYRFNVSNQQTRVLNVSSQFKELIQLLMELNECKKSFDKLTTSMEQE